MSPHRLDVCKLGGSLITGWAAPGRPAVHADLVLALGRQLADRRGRLVLFHGTGTVGKPPAQQHGYPDGRLAASATAAVAEVSGQLAVFEAAVVQALVDAGTRPFRVPLLAITSPAGDDDVALTRPEVLQELVDRGFTPVVGGSFGLARDGFRVCSSDRLAVDAALAMDARALVFATGVPGVRRRDGDGVYQVLHQDDDEARAALDPVTSDCSGGMVEKAAQGWRAAAAGVRTSIVDGTVPDVVAAALDGRTHGGTTLLARPAAGHRS